MFIVDVRERPQFVAGDETLLREVLHPAVHGVPTGYSLAHASLAPGKRSLPHRLAGSEVYYVLKGEGKMYVEGQSDNVREGMLVYVPPGATQFIENTGSGALVFLCIVEPAWSAEGEEIGGSPAQWEEGQ